MNSTLLAWLAVGAVAGVICAFLSRHFKSAEMFPRNWGKGALSGAFLALVVFVMMGDGGTSSAAMGVSTANVTAVSQDQFQSEVANAKLPVLVDFYATWCMPCRMLSPRVDDVADQFIGKIKFVKIDVDQAPALAQRYQIDGIPALLLFKNGKVIKTMVGLQSEQSLKDQLSESLKSD
jgi:thioredoxin 1